MAMNKKEQARVAELETQLAMAYAMRWPDYAKPNPQPTPEGYSKRVKAWFDNAFSRRVTEGWRTSVSHSCEDPKMKSTFGSQNSGVGYSTRLDALKAMRIEMTKQYAKWLAEVDREIERESAN